MAKLRYCTRCLYPETKPRLDFDKNGVCSACLAFDERESQQNVEQRRQRAAEWGRLVDSTKELCRERPYDCIVPVSGGKDSHYQVITALQWGLRPLAVTAMTDHLTPVGWRNLNNISKLGVDHVMVQTDQALRRKLNKYCLQTVGDISWPEHVTIFTIPVKEAVLRDIPLVIYGENPENEYGGPFDAQGRHCMTRRWLEEFGGLNGLRVSDVEELGLASLRALEQYTYPPSIALDEHPVDAVFLGYYFPWDGKANVGVAHRHGFEPWGKPADGQMIGENLDNYQTGIHDRFKFLKYGFGRVTDHLCSAIRRGRLRREDAIPVANSFDGQVPLLYMDKKLVEVLAFIDMSLEEYIEVERKFANPALFDLGGGFPRPTFKVE